MSLLAQLRRALQTPAPAPPTRVAPLPEAGSQADFDQRAVERYRYLLRTASPEHLEQVHAEAFATLTPAQRRQVLDGLAEDTAMTQARRDALADDPQALAREATRTEIRRPGTLERVLGGTGRVLAGGLLAGVAGAVVGSLVLDGLVDTGFGDGGLLDLGQEAPWAGGFGSGGGPGDGGLDLGGWFD
jgi:hypothetical protein